VTIYPPALAEHLAGDVTTICHCWRLVRADGVTLGFTDHDRPLTVDGTLCRPDSGFGASEARRSLGLGVDTVDVEGALSSAEIDGDEIRAGKFDGAIVETFLVNWAEPAQFARIRRSAVAKVSWADGHFVAELQSAMRALDRPNGRHIVRACDADLGDARCGVDLDAPAYSATGMVTDAVPPEGVIVSGLSGFADGWFTGGRLTWMSGASAGRMAPVRLHRIDAGMHRLTLQGGHEALPAPGDTFKLFAGCDKAFGTCKAKFANPSNFRGFPHLPGNDDAYGYVTDDGQFDGGALVP